MADTKVSALPAAANLTSAEIAGQTSGVSQKYPISLFNSAYQAASSVLTAVASIGTAVTGDLIYGSGASTWARLSVGTSLQHLRVNSSGTAPEWATVREVLTANRTYYVGYNLGSATVSIASPGVVTKTAHGLVAGNNVSFSIAPNGKTVTSISVATPAVVTYANSFVANQPIVFSTTGRLPKGLTPGTTYFVSATGLSGSSFQVSATSGGASIATSNPTFTVTIASPAVVTETAHGRSVGDALQFSTTGALPTGLSTGTTYFIKTVVDANSYQLSTAPENVALNTSGTQSGTHSIVQFGTHFSSETGTLPTGITAGQDYFVIATGLTANTFQFSATLGGAAVNTTGSTNGTIILKTGSDSNNGLTQSIAGSFLTLQQAWNAVAMLDMSIYTVTIQVADGMYLAGLNMNAMPVGGSGLTLTGNTTAIGNCFVNTTTHCIQLNAPLECAMTLQGFKFKHTGASISALIMNSQGAITASSIELAGGSTGFSGAYSVAAEGARLNISSGHFITGNMSAAFQTNAGTIFCFGVGIQLTNVPAMSWIFAPCTLISFLSVSGVTFNGYATGQRYQASQNSVINTNGGGATFIPGSSAGTSSSGGQYI